MKVRRVMVLAPIRSRMDPNLGMDSAMKRSKSMTQVRKTHRFQLKSEQEKAEKCPFLNEGLAIGVHELQMSLLVPDSSRLHSSLLKIKFCVDQPIIHTG